MWWRATPMLKSVHGKITIVELEHIFTIFPHFIAGNCWLSSEFVWKADAPSRTFLEHQVQKKKSDELKNAAIEGTSTIISKTKEAIQAGHLTASLWSSISQPTTALKNCKMTKADLAVCSLLQCHFFKALETSQERMDALDELSPLADSAEDESYYTNMRNTTVGWSSPQLYTTLSVHTDWSIHQSCGSCCSVLQLELLPDIPTGSLTFLWRLRRKRSLPNVRLQWLKVAKFCTIVVLIFSCDGNLHNIMMW